jgi:hypothetical protein
MHKFGPPLYSYMLAPTCFGSSLIFRELLDPSELRENTDRYGEFDILLTVYCYVSQQRNQLNTLSLSQTLYCAVSPQLSTSQQLQLHATHTKNSSCSAS